MLNATAPQPRRIVLCVDDVGLDDAIDAAALALADLHRASAASMMVDGPSWSRASARLRERANASLELGLHLNLTEAFAPGGWRVSLPALIVMAYGGLLDVRRLRGEVLRQCDAFERGVGRPPDFVDGHQHVQQLPRVREALIDVLHDRRLPHRPWVRCGAAPSWPAHSAVPVTARVKSGVIDRLGASALKGLLQQRGHAHNRALLGVRRLDADERRYDAAMRGWLSAAAEGDLLMCHPAQPVDSPEPLHHARAMEYALLTSESFGRWLERERITIVPLRAIVGAPAASSTG
jgi:predicted glycoside hydrolase/deacetylase ChbG (UPF0249 family)